MRNGMNSAPTTLPHICSEYKVVLQGNRPCFVKIISLKNGNFVLELRKRLFHNAKPTLLPCKTAAFGTQNNRVCNILTYRVLCDNYACKKYLHSYRLLCPHKITWVQCKNLRTKTALFFLIISISNHNQFFIGIALINNILLNSYIKLTFVIVSFYKLNLYPTDTVMILFLLSLKSWL